MVSKKVVFSNRFFYPDHSATAQMLSELAFYLAGAGCHVHVVASRGLYDDPSANLPSREVVRGVVIHRVYRPLFGRKSLVGRALDYFLMYGAFAWALLRLADRGDLVVAKTDPPLLSVALLPVARLKGVKFVNWLQDLYPEVAVALGMTSISLISPVLTPLRNLSLRFADANVAIGARMKSRLIELGVCEDRISVISNWSVDDDIKPIERDENALRREWGLEGRFVVAYSGNLGRAHEYQTLLAAAKKLEDMPDLLFLFIGGGALTQQLEGDVRAHDLENMFQFRPYQAKDKLFLSLTLPDVYWLSLVPSMEGLIVPSKFYGNCAAGRATIFVGDRDGELARIIQEVDCGASVNVGDSDELASVIRELRRDRDKLRQMGGNARRALEQKFSREASFASWEELTTRI